MYVCMYVLYVMYVCVQLRMYACIHMGLFRVHIQRNVSD